MTSVCKVNEVHTRQWARRRQSDRGAQTLQINFDLSDKQEMTNKPIQVQTSVSVCASVCVWRCVNLYFQQNRSIAPQQKVAHAVSPLMKWHATVDTHTRLYIRIHTNRSTCACTVEINVKKEKLNSISLPSSHSDICA